jgi:phage protein D
MAWSVSWEVTVDGEPMTDQMNPYLMSIDISDKDGTSSDTATLIYDDSDGQVQFPPTGARVVIAIDGVEVFEGITDEPRSTGARGQGMILTVPCKGFDSRGKVKESLNFHKDDATLQDFMDDAAKRAGVKSVLIDPELAQIRREYWSPGGANFLHLGENLARELGATFKLQGDTAVLAKRGEGGSPAGGTMPTVTATRGDNLLSWDIAPKSERPRHQKARVRWFDRKGAKFKEEDIDIELD